MRNQIILLIDLYKCSLKNQVREIGHQVASKVIDITLSIAEIKEITRNQFRNFLKKSIKEKAFKYLINKRGSKGKEIEYSRLKMAEYLLPQDENISILDQQYIFSIRNRMVQINHNFPVQENENLCFCEDIESMKHIYDCKYLKT